MQLSRNNPIRDLGKVQQDLDNFWGDDWDLLPALTSSTTMDLYEEDGKLIVEVSLPNYRKNEVKVTTHEGVLEVSAEHKEKAEDKGKRHYFFRESSNRFLRRVMLPDNALTDMVEAEFRNGLLKVTMPVDKLPTKQAIKTVPIN